MSAINIGILAHSNIGATLLLALLLLNVAAPLSSSLFSFTKLSLARMQAADPSDVGLHCSFCEQQEGTGKRRALIR